MLKCSDPLIRFTNGGGYGDPLSRELSRVLADVRNEYVSIDAARQVYGVVVHGDPKLEPEGLVIDEIETAALRATAAGEQRQSVLRVVVSYAEVSA